MDAAFVSCESDGDERKHDDENDALFVFRELENPEQAFHFASVHAYAACHVEQSETSLASGT
jgi:hypothetical protein